MNVDWIVSTLVIIIMTYDPKILKDKPNICKKNSNCKINIQTNSYLMLNLDSDSDINESNSIFLIVSK